ncbi:MAG: hypothetical protein KDC35_15745 [Acidobacteria bacterium]|nr:hypothetical protein [Acidobacteriota bacterium]
MKYAWILTLFTCLSFAQFDNGSDGSYGPILVDSMSGDVTLAMPADGIFHATTVTVMDNTTLRFTKNALNTPVYILAQGPIIIELGSFINVSGTAGTLVMRGEGGPGGFDGGNPGISGPAGDGYGPGGGQAGPANGPGTDPDSAGGGAYGTQPYSISARDGDVYGSALLVPLVGGSGGGGIDNGKGGGGGGGAILLSSNAYIQLDGYVIAQGGVDSGTYNNGSGGGVRLVAMDIFGNGRIYTCGYFIGCSAFASGGEGRIRVDTVDPSTLANILFYGEKSFGGLLAIFPVPNPSLDIIEAAGQSISVGSNPVTVILPYGSPAMQNVVVQGTDFPSSQNIEVVITPVVGVKTVYPAVLDMDVNPDTITVPVTLPANTVVNIHVWTTD